MAREPRNLLEDLSEDEQKHLGQDITGWVKNDLESRSQWEESQDDNFKLWACQAPERRKPWADAADMCVPMIASAVDTYASLTLSSMVDNPGKRLVEAIPVSAVDIKRAKRIAKFMDWQLLVEMEGAYEDSYDRLLPHQAITGIAMKKLSYLHKEQRPKTEFVSSLECIVPNDAMSIETARRVTHRMDIHPDTLEDDGKYINIDEIGKPGIGEAGVQPNPVRISEEERHGITTMHAEEATNIIYETHFHGSVDGLDGKHWIVWVDAKSALPIRLVRHPEGIETMFVAFPFLPSPAGGFYPYGFAQRLRGLNLIANAVTNQYLDAGRLANTPFMFVGRGAGLRGRKRKIAPGDAIDVDDVTQIQLAKFAGLDQNLPLLYQMTKEMSQDLTADTDELSGRAQKGVREPTVRGQAARIGQSINRFSIYAKRVFRSQEKELQLIYDLNSKFLSDRAKQFMVLGSSKEVAFDEVAKRDFGQRRHIKTTADPSFASPERQIADANAMMDRAQQHPLIGLPNPQTGQVANPELMARLTRDWLEALGKPDLARFVPEPADPPIDPYTENAMFASREFEDVKSGEDHALHIRVHEEFKFNPLYVALSDDDKAAVEVHIQRHGAQAATDQQLQAQAQQQAGAAPAAPGPADQLPEGLNGTGGF